MITLDLNILPIRRINGQELTELPGLLAVTPPRKTARGREETSLIAYLTLSGNASQPDPKIRQLIGNATAAFYQASGSLTFALRHTADEINSGLLTRNLSTAGHGQQALGSLVLAAIRGHQCTLLISGPAHAVWVTDGSSRHIYDPALSGKGLGSGQNFKAYLSQVELRPQDLLVLCAAFPRDWEADLLNERPPASLDASYRKLTFTKGDLNAVLIQALSGHGTITLLRPELSRSHLPKLEPSPEAAPAGAAPEEEAAPVMEDVSLQDTGHQIDEELDRDYQPEAEEEQMESLADLGAHMVQPSAYAIPPEPERAIGVEEEVKASGPRSFPASIPRAQPAEELPPQEISREAETAASPTEEAIETSPPVRRRRRGFRFNAHAEATRQMAKAMVGGLRTGRRMNERIRIFLQRFLPRLLPGAEPDQPFVLPTFALIAIAVVIPIVVVTLSSVVYLRLGQSIQYDELYGQALNARAQAVSETDPVRQRDAWQRVLAFLTKADQYREPEESRALRAEAQARLDNLMGVIRLEFVPAFPNGLGGSTKIGAMAASESDLYMLNAEDGTILHASFTGRTLELDKTFDCQPGSYGGYQVRALVDLLALPKVNALGATVAGIDANGNLLYCAPGQVPQAIPLPALPNTSWGRITSFALDSGNLYVLDAQKRSVWIFPGKDSTFIDPPIFYFENEIPSTIDSAIDLAVSADDLYLLRADGQIANCKFSRLAEVPTRCQDPAPRLDENPAHRGIDVFQLARFTQVAITAPPSSVILLLDADNQSVFRFSPRGFELQDQVSGYAGKANPFQRKPVSAMTVSPNYVLYLAIGDQVYFAPNLP